MAESAGKITITFDAEMGPINKALNDIEARIAKLGSGNVGDGGSGGGTPRRRVQASTLGGSAPVDSVSDAPIMGAHAQAAAAGMTTPVGMSTSTRLPMGIGAPGSAMRGPYELAYPNSFGGYLEMAARRGVAGDEVNRANAVAQQQQLYNQLRGNAVAGAQMSEVMASRIDGGAIRRGNSIVNQAEYKQQLMGAAGARGQMSDVMLLGDRNRRDVRSANDDYDQAQITRQRQEMDRIGRENLASMRSQSIGESAARGRMSDVMAGRMDYRGDEMQANITAQRQQMEALQRQHGTTNLRGYSANSQMGRLGMLGNMARQVPGMPLPPDRLGAGLSNAFSGQNLLGLYFTAAFGGMELQSMSQAALQAAQGIGSASSMSGAFAAQSNLAGSMYGGPVGSILANASLIGGGSASFMQSRLMQQSQFAASNYAQRIQMIQARSAIAGASAAGIGGSLGGLARTAENASANMQMNAAATSEREQALAIASRPIVAQSVGGAFAAGAIVGAPAGAMTSGPLGAVGGGAIVGALFARGAYNSNAEAERQRAAAVSQNELELNRQRTINAATQAADNIAIQNARRVVQSENRTMRESLAGGPFASPARRLGDTQRGLLRDYQLVSMNPSMPQDVRDAAGQSYDLQNALANRQFFQDTYDRRTALVGMRANAYGEMDGMDELAIQSGGRAVLRKRFAEYSQQGVNAFDAGKAAASEASSMMRTGFRRLRASRGSIDAEASYLRNINLGNDPMGEDAIGKINYDAKNAIDVNPGAKQQINDLRIAQINALNRAKFFRDANIDNNFAAREAVLGNRGNPYANPLIGFAEGAASRILGYKQGGLGGRATQEAGFARRELNNMLTPYQGSQVGNPLAYAGANGDLAEKARRDAEKLINNAENAVPPKGKDVSEINDLLKKFVEWAMSGGNN